MGLKLYYDLMSQPCRAVYLLLKANNIPFESEIITLTKGEQFSPEFTKINPLQKVPVLEHNGFILTESVAILRYLSQEFNVPDNWYPKERKHQARVDEYMSWQHLNIRYFGDMIFRTSVVIPLVENGPLNEEKLKFLKEEFEKVLDQLHLAFLKDQSYLCGNKISIADLLGLCEIDQPLPVAFDPISNRSTIKSWLQRVRKDLHPYYEEVSEVLDIMKNSIANGKL